MDGYDAKYENYKEILILGEQYYQIQQKKIKMIKQFFEFKDSKIIENKLYVNCSSYNLSELKEKYKTNQKIQEIYVYSLHQFIVDCDVDMPGVHIYIKCKQFRVIKKSLLNFKGSSGQSFQNKARNGDETNIHGDIGEAGGQGRAGGILYVDADEHYDVSQLTIDISGGDGGNGQDGGDGFDGIKGEDGNENDVLNKKFLEFKHKGLLKSDKIFQNYRSKGKEGTVGGDAGCGGKGGANGIKGYAQFEKQQIINLISNNSKLGNDGADGKPGKGGQQGTDYIGQYQVVKMFGIFKNEEWNFIKKDEKNEKFSASGKIKQNMSFMIAKDIQQFDSQSIFFKSKNKFISLQQEWIKQITNRFEMVQLTDEQIRKIIEGLNE